MHPTINKFHANAISTRFITFQSQKLEPKRLQNSKIWNTKLYKLIINWQNVYVCDALYIQRQILINAVLYLDIKNIFLLRK